MNKVFKKKNRKAFTLVELIVVLVILAVLAAMLVPALTGYIKKARKERNTEAAHYALTATQAVMTELYGKGIAPAKDKNNADIDFSNKPANNANAVYGERILELMDSSRGGSNREPYIFIFGVGKYDTYAKQKGKEALPYTVFFIAYVEDENTPPVYYIDGEWTYKYPWNNGYMKDGAGKSANKIGKGPNTGLELTLYVVSNRSPYSISDSKFWKSDAKSLEMISEQ